LEEDRPVENTELLAKRYSINQDNERQPSRTLNTLNTKNSEIKVSKKLKDEDLMENKTLKHLRYSLSIDTVLPVTDEVKEYLEEGVQ